MYEFLYRILRFITSPFRLISQALGVNRLMTLSSSFRSLFGRFGQTLGRFAPKGTWLADMRDSYQAWREERAYARLEKQDVPVIYRPEAADYSQIHLIRDDQRLVLHVGAATRSTQASALLREGSDRPLTLTFRRVNDNQYGAPFALTITGECEAAVNGRAIHGETPIPNNSRLSIDDEDYRVEFLAWQALSFAPRLEVGWYTHRGPVRHLNEDAIGIAKSPYGQFFAVADGVGGGERGDLISEYAIRYMLTVFERNIRYDYDWLDLMRQAFTNINQEVRRFAMQSQALTGTTLTCVILRGWDAFVGHVGDSRLYLVSGGAVTKITQDHVRVVRRTPIAEGSPLPAQLERNLLTRAIGKDDHIEPQLTTVRLQPGDHLLLMTDGIGLRVEEEELPRLTSTYRPTTLPEHLAVLANERFNSDNLSVIHISIKSTNRRTFWQPEAADRVYVQGSASPTLHLNAPLAMRTDYQRRRRTRALLAWGVLIALVVIIAVAVLRSQPSAAVIDASPTLRPSATASLTPSPSPTRRPPTATITPTITPTVTFIPPTSTLAPLPTSTLARPPRP
jgi:serine/threonine protein phosphatase PrpC